MNLKIAAPCQESWADMTGDDRSRFCGRCSLNVYNLSAMSQDEAAALMQKHDGKVCVRFYQRKDGTVLTQDCPVGRRRRLKLVFSLAGLAALLLGALTALASSDGGPRPRTGSRPEWVVKVLRLLGLEEPPPPPVLMGRPCPPPPPPKGA